MLDLDAYRLERAGVPVALEPKAFNLLALMVQRPGHLFTKQEIFDLVWPGTAVTDHALTRIVAQIRRALGDEAREARYLETVPTRGYRWIHPVEAIDGVPAAVEPHARTLAPSHRRTLAPSHPRCLAHCRVVALRPGGGDRRCWSGRVDGDVSGSEGAHGVQWPVQLTTNAGLDLHPALSPHDDAIAFVSDRTGSFEIFVRALDGSATETPLTSDGGQNVQPSWSPDGKFIAYHSQRNGGIWIVPSRGGTPKQIVTEGSKPAWSPDGAQHRLSVRRACRCGAIRLRGAERFDDSHDVRRWWSRRASSRAAALQPADTPRRRGVRMAATSALPCSMRDPRTACGCSIGGRGATQDAASPRRGL